jgi:phosphatidylserine/phosphatidylglycerophosphate/cardiolipin synthase-like enzyme
MAIPTLPIASVVPLEGSDYLNFLLDRIGSAKARVWASIFIIDARVHKDELLLVRAIIDSLSYARWRGVDVRVVVGTATIVDTYVACLGSAYYMRKQGLGVRGFGNSGRRKSTHSKYVVVDDGTSIIGSGNWSHEALHLAVNSAVAIESLELTSALSREFSNVWESSTEIVYEGKYL